MCRDGGIAFGGSALRRYFRDYDSGTGRYVQSDPVGHLGGINTYGYAVSNPLAWFDPDGMQAKPNPRVPHTSPRGPARFTPPNMPPANDPFYGPARGVGVGAIVRMCMNPVTAGIVLMMIPGNIGQDGSCSDDPFQERDECKYDDGCNKATPWQLKAAGIEDAHAFKSEYGAVPNSRFDICACKDGSIVIKAQGMCGKPSAMIQTFERWK